MNYQFHYDKLIERGKIRGLKKHRYDGNSCNYYEKHHIIPRCMNGSDNDTNLVLLTPEEHFLAHLLLTKIHPNNHSLLYAANMMCIGNNRNNKRYGWVRKKLAFYLSILNSKPKSEEFKQNISKKLKGEKHSAIHHKKVIDSKRKNGKLSISSKTKNKISATMSKLKWYNDGNINIRSNVQPENFNAGRLKFTHKKRSICEKEIPILTNLPIFLSNTLHGNSGKHNVSWNGYYVTPDGIFESSTEASKFYKVTDKTIRDRCRSKNLLFKNWICIKDIS